MATARGILGGCPLPAHQVANTGTNWLTSHLLDGPRNAQLCVLGPVLLTAHEDSPLARGCGAGLQDQEALCSVPCCHRAKGVLRYNQPSPPLHKTPGPCQARPLILRTGGRSHPCRMERATMRMGRGGNCWLGICNGIPTGIWGAKYGNQDPHAGWCKKILLSGA